MFLAIIGALIAMFIIFIINWIFNKDHGKEIKESFRIPDSDKPVGEKRLKEYVMKR